MLKIKVCGMREKSNIDALNTCMPDMIGFIFYPLSSRFVGWDFKPDERIDALKVGVFVNESIEKITEIAHHAALDFIQLHGEESPEFCRLLNKNGIKIIKAFSIKDGIDFSQTDSYAAYCEYFLFDTATSSKGGSGLKFDWKVLENYTSEKGFMLSGGIGIEDIEKILKLKNPAMVGVDINSRFELSTGIKDIDQINTFIHAIRDIK
ncbi:MAG: phosphoribosylanthranilate isomerase [Bacteroidales bacterium]|nr:phosphoribosylanthranilate isomerase [Bacteroidales bacterium]